MSIRLLVVGADGFDPRLGEYFCRKGYLPIIDRLVSNGRMASMASRLGEQDVPHTGPAWISLYTGVTEREHGVTFGGWLDGHVSFESYADSAVFNSLIQEGYTVGSAFMPVTYPATVDTKNGSWMVSGFPSAKSDQQNHEPNDLISHLPADYQSLQARSLLGSDNETIAPIQRWENAEKRKHEEILLSITNERPVDVLFYGTQLCDVIAHRQQPVPPYIDAGVRRLLNKVNEYFNREIHPPRLGTLAWDSAMQRAYQAVDRTIGALVDQYEPDDVLVVSDHGFQLNGRDHALLGTSIATSDVTRPEHLTEVRFAIEEYLDIDTSSEPFTVQESMLSDEEQSEIKGRLESLGYQEE